ncbi:MAG: hypothetical protein AB4426_31185 [Xenococcaceae cyanobacterium]
MSGAFSPPQDLSEGIVRIQIVQGALEKLEIIGLNRLQESYLSKRLWLAASPPPEHQQSPRSLTTAPSQASI